MPLELPFESGAQVDRGLPAELVAGRRDLTLGARDVTGTFVIRVAGGLDPDERLEVSDEGVHRGRLRAGHVEHGTGRNVGEQRLHRRLDDVVDEGEVAHLQAVSVDRERTSVEQALDEAVGRHVRTLTRAVHGEVPQRHGGEAGARVGADECLGRELGDAVGAGGAWLTRGPEGVGSGAVHRGAGRVDEPAHAAAGRRFEQTLGGEDVPVDVPLEVRTPGVRDARLAGEMSHQVDAVEHLVEAGGEQVAGDQLEPRVVGDRLGVRALAIGVVEIGEGIEPADRVAPAKERLTQVAADEAGRTRDQNLAHAIPRELVGVFG